MLAHLCELKRSESDPVNLLDFLNGLAAKGALLQLDTWKREKDLNTKKPHRNNRYGLRVNILSKRMITNWGDNFLVGIHICADEKKSCKDISHTEMNIKLYILGAHIHTPQNIVDLNKMKIIR